jgi:hypothetical protein
MHAASTLPDQLGEKGAVCDAGGTCLGAGCAAGGTAAPMECALSRTHRSSQVQRRAICLIEVNIYTANIRFTEYVSIITLGGLLVGARSPGRALNESTAGAARLNGEV